MKDEDKDVCLECGVEIFDGGDWGYCVPCGNTVFDKYITAKLNEETYKETYKGMDAGQVYKKLHEENDDE